MHSRRFLLLMATLLVALGLGAALYVRSLVKGVPGLFLRSSELKAQGYYMAEFEFKMLAVQQLLNQGSYWKAICTLRRVREEMKTTRGLVKMPGGSSPEEQVTFLLERQCPSTGAFMDPSYPLFTYFASTENVLEALMELSHETGRPVKLKYPLRFLDRIGTPQRLRAYLDSLLYLREPWAKLPGPGPSGVAEVASYQDLELAGVYQFSEEWKDALRGWFEGTQDPATGFWGARIGARERWRQRRDISSTYHVLKLIVDDRGRDRSEKFPLRHAGALARSVLELTGAPMPADAASQHEWGLNRTSSAQILTRFLWPHLSEPEREQVRGALRELLAASSDLARPDGGFAFYSSGAAGDVDGTGLVLSNYRAAGVLFGTWERERLWGEAIAAIPPPARTVVRDFSDATVPDAPRVTSIRVYSDRFPAPEAYDDLHLLEIVYPTAARGLDAMDLRQRVARFIALGKQTIGNWTSMQSLRDEALDLRGGVNAVPITRGGLDLARLGRDHPNTRRLCVVGYDLFQVPVFRSEFVLADGPSSPARHEGLLLRRQSPHPGSAGGTSQSVVR